MHAEDSYLFRHALVRDAAYQLQLPRFRGQLHSLAVELIELVFNTKDGRDSVAGDLAEHCRIAREALATDDLLEKEKRYTWDAAQLATDSFKNSDAERFLRHYLDICEGSREVDCLCKLASICLLNSDIDAAEKAARRAVMTAVETDSSEVIKARRMLAEVIYQRGHASDALRELKLAYHESRAHGKTDERYKTAQSQANVLKYLGRMQSAERLYRSALKYFENENEDPQVARLKNSIGSIYYNTGRYDDAEAILLEVLSSAGGQDPQIRAGSLQSIANLYEESERIPEAEEAYRRALLLTQQIGSQGMQGNVIGNLAILIHQLGRLSEAEPLYHRALALHREAGLVHSEAISLSNIAGFYRDQKNLVEADKLFHDALSVAKRTGSKRIEGVIEGNLAGVVRDLGRIDEARVHYEQALESHRYSSNQYFEAVHGVDWALLEMMANNFKAARSLWKEHVTTLRQLEASREIELRIGYMLTLSTESGVEPLE